LMTANTFLPFAISSVLARPERLAGRLLVSRCFQMTTGAEQVHAGVACV
jgi:hypothetical protein